MWSKSSVRGDTVIRVGLIGAGFIGKIHAEAIEEVENVQLHMIYDINEKAAQDIAKRHSCRVASSFDQLLDSVDAVILAIPTTARRPYLEEIFRRGIPTLSEKPLARTLEEAEWIVSRVKETGTKFMVDHVVRFFPEYREVHLRVKGGSVGRVSEARSFRGGPFPSWSSWFRSFEKSGGVILDLAIHDIDYWLWTLGDVVEIQARSLNFSESIEKDHCYILLKFESGAVAHVEGTWAYPQNAPFKTSIEVVGSDGSLHFESTQISPLIVYEDDGTYVESPTFLNPYARVIKSFADSVERGTPVEVTAEDAFRALKIALLSIESAKERKTVKVVKGI